MRDQKRRERALMEEAYQRINENLGPAALTASVPGVSQVPLVVGDEESCGSLEPDMEALATQAIAAIAELAAAAGAKISVTVETEQEEVHEVDVPINQFNTGYEDVGST
jgi:hypothetical protein